VLVLLMLGFVVAASGYGTGCRQSTREDIHDDEVGPESSGPYAADVKETTREIIAQLKKQKVIDRYLSKYGEPPIIALITPQNDTTYVEVTQFFQEDLLSALMREWTRDELRVAQRDPDVLDAIEKEKLMKEAGELTDRTGRRTRLGADYFLKAKFSQLGMTDGRTTDDTLKYSYELIDPEIGELIFKGEHDIRRVSEARVVYR
jgi:hypothetical protein